MKARKTKRILAIVLSLMLVAELVFSAIMSIAADPGSGTKEVTKQLIDFSNTTVAKDIALAQWPKGLEKMNDKIGTATYKYNAIGFSVDIAEDEGDKFLKFNFDDTNNITSNNAYPNRKDDSMIYLKTSVPYWYITYLKDINLDYVYNYNKSGTNNTVKAFYVLGISNGVDKMGKSNSGNSSIPITSRYADSIDRSASVQRGSVKKSITDLYYATVANAKAAILDKNTAFGTNSEKWDSTKLNAESKIDIVLMFSAPKIQSADTDEGYYFGVKGISVTLEGPEVEMDNVDNEEYVNPYILNFEEGATLSEIKTNTASTTKFGVSAESELVAEANSGNGALRYAPHKGGAATSTVQYDSNMSISLKRAVTRSKGITFMARNISSRDIEFRIWIAVGNDTGSNAHLGKYQAFVKIPANQTEYTRYSIYWDNVGLMSFASSGQWWATSGSGYSISDDELASGLRMDFKYPAGMSPEEPGVYFDDFEYITAQFVRDRNATIVDFSGSETGKSLPKNVKISGNYEGSNEIIENADGTKSLKFNFDAPAKGDKNSEMHHLRSRQYYIVSVDVPRGSMDDVANITVDMTNNVPGYLNRVNTDVSNGGSTRFDMSSYAMHYNIGVYDSDSLLYGKFPEVNSTVSFEGNRSVTQKIVGFRKTGSYGMTAWVSNEAERWQVEEMKNIDRFLFYISAPDCDGTEGYSFLLNSISVSYNEPPKYNENESRQIVGTDKAEALTSGKITAKDVAVGTVDPNSSEFTQTTEVTVKDATNTESIVYKNLYSEFYRNMKPFYDKATATFHMFAFSNKDIDFKVSLLDKNNSKLDLDVAIKAATNKLYTEASVGIKEVYDAAIAADPTFTFDMTDIRAISVLPVVTEACSFKIAGVTVLTGEYENSAANPEKQKVVNLVNFDNCKVGSKGDSLELPAEVTVSGYNGTKSIVRTADGSNALQVNYDKIADNGGTGDSHQTYKRINIVMSVKVPKGSLSGLKKIKYTITQNCYKLSEQTDNFKRSYYTIAASTPDSIFVKQGESAGRFDAQPGVTSTLTLDLEKGVTGNNNYNLTSWFNPQNHLPYDEKYTSEFTTVHFYFAVPDIDGVLAKKGHYMQINSIDLEFESKPDYADETTTREIINGVDRDVKSNNTKTITSKQVELASNNINYRQFNRYFTVEAKSGNTATVEVQNSNYKFMRNAEYFVDTANFRMFYQTAKATKAQIIFVDVNGDKLPFNVSLVKSNSDKFDECIVTLKKIYEAFKTENPEAKFDLSNITSVQFMPLSTTKVNIASIGLWTKEPGAAGSPGNYYQASPDDTIRVEAYNYNISDDFTIDIQYLDADSTFADFGTTLPAGAKVISMVKITLRNGKGEMVQPTGRFWVSIKLPDGTELTNVKMYEVFYNGSLVPIKRYVMDHNNYISCEDYFATKTYAIMIVPPVEEEEVGGPSGGGSDGDYYYEEEPMEDDEYIETPSQQTIIKRYKRYKKAVSADYTWLWITIAVGAAVLLLAAGGVIFLIVFKKKRKAAEGDVTQ